MQFEVQEGIGCIEVPLRFYKQLIICKIFSCFLDVCKAFNTVWVYGLLYKLFIELSAGDRMWLTIKD